MTDKGHIKTGSVVLDEPIALPDGAEVTVDLVPVRPMREYRGFLRGMDTTIDREDHGPATRPRCARPGA
jgi:hypothetical protein